jgi:4-coumarate--CoA ligase
VLFIDPPTQREHTFASLKKATDDFARALKTKWNWKKSDVFGVFSPNHIDYVIPLVGGPRAGAAVSPISASFGVEEVIFQLKNSGAQALVTHPDVQKVALEAAKACNIPANRILFLEAPQNQEGKFQTVKEFCELGASAGTVSWDVINPKKDVLYLPYSSGTTGKPKGVLLSHRNLIANLLQMTTAENEGPLSDAPEDNSCVAFLPFSHIYGEIIPSIVHGWHCFCPRNFSIRWHAHS